MNSFFACCLPGTKRPKPAREIKILLLGTGESGKSTIVKQMRIIHHNGYTRDELLRYLMELFVGTLSLFCSFKKDIFRNVVEGMQQMLIAMSKLSIEFKTQTGISASEMILGFDLESIGDAFPIALCPSLLFLWHESGLKPLYDKLSQISYILCSAPYFFDNMSRIMSPMYLPSLMDVLKARIKTSGIMETRFNMGSQAVCLVDVGGQISERKKWISCFENVTSIIFCVSLSEYDQVLLEDPNQSRMLDSFLLFQSIINSQWFINTSIILFLNKTDIFARKLVTSPLSRYFDDYTGGTDFDAGAAYIKAKFLSLNHMKLPIYPHYTCATDTKQIEAVFAAVKETILAKTLKESGIL